MRLARAKVIGTWVALTVAAAWCSLALPIPRPSSYFGTVSVEGSPVGPGVALTAEIGGVEFEATTTFEFEGFTVYRIDVPADIAETPGVEGGTEGQVVDFFLNGVPVTETGTWSDGTYTNLDLTIPPGADLTLAKDDGVTEADPGDTLTYTLTVINANAVDASGIVLEDPLPVGTSFVSASDGGSEAGGVVTWPAFDLAGSATTSRTLVLQVDNTFPAGTAEIVNVATVASDGSDGFDPNPADNSATDADTLNGGPDLAVTKTADLAELRPGDTVTYTLEVTNNGFQDAVDVRLTDVLPPNLIFQSATGEGAILGSIVQWPVFDVALGATVTRTYRVRLDPLVPVGFTQLVNTASVTEGNNLELDAADNTTSLTLPILEAPDLAILFVDLSGAPVDPQALTISGQIAVELANAGNLDAFGAFDVAIFEDLNGNGTFEPGTDNLLGIAPVGSGLTARDTLTLDVPVAGTVLFRNSPLYAFVDSGEVVAEHDETNNIDTAASACAAIPTPGDFNPVTEMAWPVPGTPDSFSRDSASVPLVVHLTDDNGDGKFDENDVPSIVFVSIDLFFPPNPAPRLRAIRGDTGATLWSAPQVSAFWVYALTGAAAGDIDNDGRPEIIVSMISTTTNVGNTNRLAAYEHNGTFKWFSSIYNTHPNGSSLTNRDNPSIADLDQDGVPEIIVGANVFNNNGSFKWIGSAGQGYQSARNANANDSGAISIAADLNLSGGLELVTGNTAYNADGTIQWQIPFDDGYPSIGNFDADPFPEIVVVSRGDVRLHEHDGTLIWGPIPLPGDNPEAGGAATIGNFDADPEPEIGVAGSTQYTVFEPDGSIKWQQTIQDGSSNMTGSTVFDFDADGLAEVVYRDEVFLRIFRGIDGVVLFQTAIGSFTANEEAVVADVDNDGNAEIIISSNQTSTRGIRVIGDANDNWAAARGAWNQHQYHIDNINDDGSIPQFEAPGWQTHNSYRANQSPSIDNPLVAPDVSASQLLFDLSLFPAATVTARIGNGGATTVGSGLSVAFYDGDPGAGGTLLGTTTTTTALSPGEFQDVSIDITLPGTGSFPVFVVADDDGTGQGRENECDELNNLHSADAAEALGLGIVKDDGIGSIGAGDTTTYVLTISNANAVDRTGVAVSDTLPPELLFVSASDGGSEAGGVVTWPTFTLPANGTVQRLLTVQVDPALDPGVTSVTNTASVTDDGTVPDPTPGNNTDTDTNQIVALAAEAGGPYVGDEGSPIAFDGSGSSISAGSIVLYEWDFEDDGTFDASGVTPSHTYPDNGVFTALLKVTSDTGQMATDTAQVTVANVAPTVDAGADQAAGVGQPVDVLATFADAGAADTHTATIDWGDGSPVEPGVVDQVAGTVSGSHTYAAVGMFTVEVCVTDDDGDTTCDTLIVDVSGDPILEASKTDLLFADNDGDTVPSPGDEIEYTIVVSNTGAGSATGVVLTDMIPADTTVVAGSVTATQGVVDSEDPVQVTIGEIAGGGNVTVTFRVVVDNPVPAGLMEVSNQGTVTSNELPAVLTDDPDLGGDADPTETMIQAAPDLVAEKSDALAIDADGDTVPSPGDTLEYTVTLKNNGNTSATGVVLTDAIPADTSVVAGSVTTTQGVVDSEDPVQVTVGEIAGGMGTATITFRVLIDDPVPAGVMEVSNQGTASSNELADVPTDDPDVGGDADPTVTMIAAEPDLLVEKVDVLFADNDGDTVASPGDELLYQIAIDNTGNTSATSVVLTDAIPANTTIVAGTVQTSQGAVVSEDPVQVDLGEIAGGAGTTVSFRVSIDDPFPPTELAVANQASVESAELAPVPSDDPDTPAAADPTATEVFITPALSIGDATELEADAAATGLSFVVTVSVASNRAVSVDFATSDQTALAGLDYQAAAGTLAITAGDAGGAIIVTGLDDLLDETDETLTVELVNPLGATIADGTGLGTILDDDAAPALSIDDVTVAEGDAGAAAALFTVSLSGPSSFAVSVDFATADGSASGGADYTAASGTVVIPAGAVSAAIPIDVLGDLVDEADETYTVELSGAVNATIADGSGLGTILDDDDPPALSIDDVSLFEGDAGATAAVFTVSLSAPSGLDVSVDFATADGSATAGADYTAAAGTVTIPAGSVSAPISIDVLGDLDVEADEIFTVELANPVNATIADGSGLGTILDDDVVMLPDLVVVNVDASGVTTDPQTLQTTGPVNATVRNDGNGAAASDFTVTFFDDVDGDGAFGVADLVLAQETVVGPLAVGEQRLVAVNVDYTASFAGDLIYAFADSELLIDESDETNNVNQSGEFCEFQPPGGFDVEVEWSWTSTTVEPNALNVMMTPAVADVNDDGIPDVVFGSTATTSGLLIPVGFLRALDGSDGSEIFTVNDPALRIDTACGVAVGDIDLDGRPEIVACDNTGSRLITFEHDGTFKWRSPGLEAVNWGSPAIADLDGDGTPEIVVGRQALDNSGALLWTGTGGRAAQSNTGPASLVADIDLDGSPDVVAGRTAYNADGSVKWDTLLPDGYNAVGNFDADDFPEIVLVASGQVRLLEHDGTLKWGPSAIPGGGNGGPPTIADYDADGEAEIGVAGGTRYVVFETDGTLKWAAVTQDGSSSRTGSSVFDFEGDGSAEVVYRDERFLRVYSGTNGGVLFQTPMSSCTWLEYVLVADVDADGNAEIVASANNNCGFGPQRGVFVFGDSADNWVATRQLWNQHTYHVTNVDDDATIPANESASWLPPGPNSYRAQALVRGNPFAAPDLTVSNLSVGQAGCPAEVAVTARVGNAGANLAAAPVDVAFYQGDPAAGGVLLGTAQTSVDLQPGEFEDVTLTFAAVAGTEPQVCVAVDEAGAVGECDEANTVCADIAPACANADLEVTKSDGLATAIAGDPLQYTVTVTNLGPDDVAVAEVGDILPAALLSPTWSCTASGGASCTAGPVAGDILDTVSLPAGDNLTYLVSGTIDENFLGVLSNTATVGALITDVDPSNNSATDTTEVVAVPELAVTKSDALSADNDGDTVPSPSDELQYIVVIANSGAGAATGVVLTDMIPANTAVVPGSVTTSHGVVDGEDPVQVTIGEIAGGGAVTVTFRVVIDDPFPASETAVANQATVASAELPAVFSDDPDTPAAGDPTGTEVFITPAISIGDAAELEVDAAATGVSFALTLSVAPNREVRVDFATADGTATAGIDYTATAGTLVFAAGETAGSIVIAGIDDALDEPDETFTVELSSPVGATIADASGLGTLLDDDDPPALAIDDVSVAEGDAGATSAAFTVSLSAASGLDVSVDFATADGTAVAGLDYTAAAGTLTIPAGSLGGTVPVDVLGDLADEPDETYTVELSAPVNATIADGSGLGTILDDDETEISIGDAALAEGDAGSTDMLFPVSLSSPAGADLSVDFASADGTATAGADYTAVAGTLTIPAGASEGTIAVPVLGDLLLEGDETFTVELSNPVGGVLFDPAAVGTILDDDECAGPNLLANPGAEEPLAAGELPGWTEVVGTDWQPRFDNPPPAEGAAYFFAGAVELGELRQDVDVSAYAATIDGGAQDFRFTGSVRTFDELPADTVRIVLEYRDGTNTVVLDAFDSGEIFSPLAWQLFTDERAAPVGTRFVRLRLIATRLAGTDNDGYFDGLSLVSLRTPVVTVSDATVTEGDAGTTPATFDLTLNCPVAQEVSVVVSTADGTAAAGDDYVALAPTSVVFPAGTTIAAVTVDVLGDLLEEDDETFFVDLSSPLGAVVVDPTGVGTILDDDGEPFCPRSPGFWKNHLDEWPVGTLELGGIVYGQTELLAFLHYGGSDASLKLARQLTATKLNLASGSDPAIQPVVDEADAFLVIHPPGSRPKGGAKNLALALKDALDDYNNDSSCLD